MKKSELLENIHAQVTTRYGWYDIYYESGCGCWKYRMCDSEVYDELRAARNDHDSITVQRLMAIRSEIIANGTFYRTPRIKA